MALRHHGPLIAVGLALVVGLAALALLARADSGPLSSSARTAATAEAPAGTVTLTPIASAGSGEMVLQWTSTVTDVTRWEYLVSKPRCRDGWEAWAVIPSGGPATGSHRVHGLDEDSRYCFQVRARTASGATAASHVVEARTLTIGPDGIARIRAGNIVEGGRTYRVSGTRFVIDVPAGMLVQNAGVAWNHGPNEFTVMLIDVASGSHIFMDAETGEWLNREIATQAQNGAVGQTRDVNALFDQIVASSRRQPAP